MQTTETSLQTTEERFRRPALHETHTQPSSISRSKTRPSTSWDTQTVVADDENDEHRSNQQIASRRQISPRDVSDRLEPFEAMPVKLDRFAEALVSFYLLQYPQATYVFNQNLNPHPVYTNFAIAMDAPACFQVILARSALYKKSAGQYGTSLEKAELDTAVVEHKANAIQRIRKLSEMKSSKKDELVASIISIGTLEMRMGSTVSGDVHYSAVRRLLKSIGGPMNIKDLRLKRVMCFFECIYATPKNSYIWDMEDFEGILERFNGFLGRIWEIWKERSGTLEPASTLSESKPGFPFPTLNAKPPVKAAKVKTSSVRKPTGPHSPYFGLQPLPEVVPRPTQRPDATVQEPSSKAAQIATSSRVSAASLARAPKASSSAKRSIRPDPRPSAKTRAKTLEKQKEKQYAMHVDTKDPTEAIPQSRYAAAIVPPPAEQTSPLTPQQTSLPSKRSYWKLHPESALHRRLSLWDELPPSKQSSFLIWDLACLFCLSAIILDLTPSSHSTKSQVKYMSKLSKIVHDANLHVSENNSNMMWLIQTNDSSEEHSKRMWEVAAFTWVCKHLNENVRRRLRDWLFTFLCGEDVQRRMSLTTFDFSYDSEMA